MKYMKLKNIAFALMGLTMMACTDQNFTELDKGNTPLAITPSSDHIFLEERNHSVEAFDLSWTTGTNFGSGHAITYDVQLAAAGTGFSSYVVLFENVERVYNWKPTVEDLNGLLIDEMGFQPYDDVNLEARVIAHVAGLSDEQVATTKFTVIPYKPVTSTLYLVGDATPNGWDAGNATEMTRTDNGIFTWTGNLNAGEMKFLVKRGDWLPCYCKLIEGMLYYREKDDEPDDKFIINEMHCYKVDVNLLDMSISITQVEGVKPAYDNLFFVGNETGWGFWPMTVDPLDPFLFRIGVNFSKGGEFKFGTAEGSWENMYKATSANAPYTQTSMEFIKGFDPDNKWNLTETGAFKICVDLRTGKERMLMKKFDGFDGLWLVGDATPNGWDLGNATAMNKVDEFTFTWTGNLNTGEMKISTDKQSDWMGGWFMSSMGNKAPEGKVEHTVYINKSDDWCAAQYLDIGVGGIDNKWKITSAGEYTITINTLKEEILIQKQ